VIAIIDYNIGNIGAVANMLARLGHKACMTSQATDVAAASGIILPGNGSFDACMQNLRATGLVPLLEERVFVHQVPLLGICVGAQMLGKGSEEGDEPGLGWIDAIARRFPDQPDLRVPNMGWNSVDVSNPSDMLGAALEPNSRFYFVHSYYLQAADERNVILKAHYGIEYAAAIGLGCIRGVQFHPEKSHRFGKRLLGAFAGLC
jgi:glutamine amidotransferase